jgi:hypothetical protein
MLYIGEHPLSDAVDVVSRCRSTGGSFLRNPLPGGRADGGLPEGRMLALWQRDHALWALGAAPLLRDLASREPAIGWRQVQVFSEGAVRLWKAEPSGGARR